HRMIDRPPHLDDRQPALQQRLGLLAHDVAHPLRARPLGVVVMHAADDVANLLVLALFVAGGAQRVIEHDDALGAADFLYQRLTFRVVNAADLVLVVEIPYSALIADKTEALALEIEAGRQRPAIQNLYAMGLVAAALALVAPTRIGNLRDKLLAGIGEVDQLRLDCLGRGVEFGDIGHLRSSQRFFDDRHPRPFRQPPRNRFPREAKSAQNKVVVPAKAGTHLSKARAAERWIPAFAGTTEKFFVSTMPLW